MRLVLISDTHGNRPNIPDGDVLIHAGDISMMGTVGQVKDGLVWISSLPHKVKILIAGNHDFLLRDEPQTFRDMLPRGITYLRDERSVIGELSLWGSPWTPEFFDWAFMLPRGERIKEKWDMIPGGLDVLITHGPPFGILDQTYGGMRAGCEELAKAVERVKPRLHVFGHIHEAHGIVERGGTIFVNAALGYHDEHDPIVIDL